MDSSQNQFKSSSSSLVELKAELHRKKQTVSNLKSLDKSSKIAFKKKGKFIDETNDHHLQKKNRNVTLRNDKDLQDDQDEEKNNKKITESLQRKAFLYDQMKKKCTTGATSKTEEEYIDRFLVNFSKHSVSSECRNHEAIQQDTDKVSDLSHESKESKEMISEDMKKDLIRKKWELDEMANLEKNDLHYQNVLFEEARSHGTAYYAFHKDHQKRMEQQESLKNLHREANESKIEKTKNETKKKQALDERLKRIRDKKRLKMGLPIIEDNIVEMSESINASEDDEKRLDFEKEVEANLKELREQIEVEKRQNQKVREWDIGKNSFLKGEKKIMSQKEWIHQRREDRNAEFAPPNLYNKEDNRHRNISKNKTVNKKANNKKFELLFAHHVEEKECITAIVEPPVAVEHNLMLDRGDSSKKLNPMELLEQQQQSNSSDFSQFLNSIESTSSVLYMNSNKSVEPSASLSWIKDPGFESDKFINAEGYGNLTDGNIDTVRPPGDDDIEEDDHFDHKKHKTPNYAAIPPPTSMNYFTSAKTDTRKYVPSDRLSYHKLQDSISYGINVKKNKELERKDV